MEIILNNKETSGLEQSPLQKAYILLSAKTPTELLNRYVEEDQKLMYPNNNWDYKNKNLVINKVKDTLETTSDDLLPSLRNERQEILWLWYHHAISCAIWRYKDKEMAKKYALKALGYQKLNHKNQITKLFYLILNGQIKEAETWVTKINNEPQKSTALKLLKEHKEWFL